LPITEPRFLLRRRRDQPGKGPGPDQRPGDPLDEPGGVEQGDLSGEAEDEARKPEQEQAVDDRFPRPHAAGDETRGQ
jgi:hypothetical protein